MTDQQAKDLQAKVDAVRELCERYAHSGVNLETHRLAAKVLELLGTK